MKTVERTLILLKPDAVQRGVAGEILSRFERVGLKIIGMKMVSPSKDHYHVHYEDISKMITRRGQAAFDATLDAMMAGIWVSVRGGNLQAIDRALKIMARRAEYLGLDAPAKIDISVLVKQAAEQLGLTDEERAELAADVTAFIAEQKAATP